MMIVAHVSFSFEFVIDCLSVGVWLFLINIMRSWATHEQWKRSFAKLTPSNTTHVTKLRTYACSVAYSMLTHSCLLLEVDACCIDIFFFVFVGNHGIHARQMILTQGKVFFHAMSAVKTYSPWQPQLPRLSFRNLTFFNYLRFSL